MRRIDFGELRVAIFGEPCQPRHVCVLDQTVIFRKLASQLAQEFALIHAIFERFAAVDEYDGHFVVELTSGFGAGVDVDFLPHKTAMPRELREAFLHHFAQVTPFAGIDDDVARLWHAGEILARKNGDFPQRK